MECSGIGHARLVAHLEPSSEDYSDDPLTHSNRDPDTIMSEKGNDGPVKELARAAVVAVLLVIAIRTLTHVVLPRLLTHYAPFPALADTPKRTATPSGTAADPVNIVFVGTSGEIQSAMRAAGWTPADSLSRASDIAIAKSVLLNRPDSTAPVSTLFLLGHRQDAAFEQEVGRSARQRHHVRLWLDPALNYQGRSVWLGSATYDARAGLSHRTFRPTHHIAPDVDEERDALAAALVHAQQVSQTFRVTGMGVRVWAHNGEGDRFDTDGEQRVLVLSPANALHPAPTDPGVPALVALKDRLWQWGHRFAHG